MLITLVGVGAPAGLARTVAGWRAAAPMNVARDAQSALLLPNGRVFVYGGVTTATAEIYDPATNTWTAAAGSGPGGPPTPGGEATVVMLRDGRVLASGGPGGPPFGTPTTASIYDPASNSWTAAASMAIGRGGHTATLLPNGKVLVAGGTGDSGVLSSTEIYDPVANAWSPGPAMSSPRADHTATLLPNGTVLVVGGYDASGALSSAEIYDPTANKWSSATSMTDSRFSHHATLLSSGQVLITGGRAGSTWLVSAEIYDPVTNAWRAAASLDPGQAGAFAISLLPNGQVLASGGGSSPTSFAEIYDPASNAWTPTASMLSRRDNHTATLLPNGDVLVAGGYDGTALVNSTELYGPQDIPDATPQPVPSPSPQQEFPTHPHTKASAAQIRFLTIVPRAFLAASSGPAARSTSAPKRTTGATVSYTDTSNTTTTITIQRPASTRARRSCAPRMNRARHGSSCRRYLHLASFTRHDIAGTDTFRLTGRVNNKPLSPGLYRLVAIPHNAAGPDAPAYAQFRILANHR